MKVKLMGGPCMGKVIDLHPNALRVGRYDVVWTDSDSIHTLRSLSGANPTAPVASYTNYGYYQPSRREGVWTFVGKYEGDKYKSSERRMKLWKSKIRKLQSQGVPSHLWPSPPSTR